MTSVFKNTTEIDKSQFLKILEDGKVPLMCGAIVDAAHYIDDYDWLLQQYTLLLRHPEMEIRGATIASIGHLARLNKRAKKEELLSILQSVPSGSLLVGRVEDAVDDINTFCRENF